MELTQDYPFSTPISLQLDPLAMSVNPVSTTAGKPTEQPAPEEPHGKEGGRIRPTPMVKLTLNSYLMKRGCELQSFALPEGPHGSDYIELFKLKEVLSSEAEKFFDQPIENEEQGCYNLFNYTSRAPLYSDPPTADGVSLLAHYIFNYDFEQAVELLDRLPKTIVYSMLSVILNSFINLKKIVLSDSEVSHLFFNRSHFWFVGMAIKDEVIEESTCEDIIYDFSEESRNLFSNGKNLEEKTKCIMYNLLELKKFVNPILLETQNNDYLRLIFTFLANTEDEASTNTMFGLLMDSRDLYVLDRLNFAQRLLNPSQRRKFIAQIKEKVIGYTNLSNLILFHGDREIPRFLAILVNYLDETGDLEAVSRVCLEYGGDHLIPFIDMYHEKLILGHQHQLAEKLEYHKTVKLDSLQLKPLPRKKSLKGIFLDYVNFETEKVELPELKKLDIGGLSLKNSYKSFVFDPTRPINKKLCYICFQERRPTDEFAVEESFVECSKCKHGGHLTHLLKWYEETSMCPKNDCACSCN